MITSKIRHQHQERLACVYVRQSTLTQVQHHQESTERQYHLADRATALGWPASAIEVSLLAPYAQCLRRYLQFSSDLGEGLPARSDQLDYFSTKLGRVWCSMSHGHILPGSLDPKLQGVHRTESSPPGPIHCLDAGVLLQ